PPEPERGRQLFSAARAGFLNSLNYNGCVSIGYSGPPCERAIGRITETSDHATNPAPNGRFRPQLRQKRVTVGKKT
ncbi:MAG: hypothetical protein ACREDY_18055, partial [Bradyrhizobium sp.]